MCSKYSVRPTVAKIYLQSDGLEKNKVLTGDVESTSVEDGGENVCGLWSLGAYLIFVIFLHGQNFWKIKFTPKFTQ